MFSHITFQNVLIPRVVKMEGNKFDENVKISDFDDEIYFVLQVDELNEINGIGSNSGTDGDDSDTTIMRKKRRIANI